MSKIKEWVKKGTLLSAIVVIVIAVGLVLGALCGFNSNETYKNAKTLTITVDEYHYNAKLDTIEDICEDSFGGLKVLYQYKSKMSGVDCELVYVFSDKADLTNVENTLKATFDAETANGGKVAGANISVSSASEDVSAKVAKGFILRAVLAAVVIAVLAFAYVTLRHSLGMGIVAAASAIVGAGLTSAILLITRIPVTTSVAYVAAVAAMMSLVVTVLTLNKVHETISAEEEIEETVVKATPVCTIVSLTILVSAAMLLVGVISLIGAGSFTVATWFAIATILAMAVVTFVGVIYAPALYCILKGCVDKDLGAAAKSDYVGAKKTSTKIKKVFEKKVAEKKETKTEEVVEEAPCCCGCADCGAEEVAEATEEVEEVVEEEAPCCCGCADCGAEEVAEEAEATESEENND